MNNRQCQGEGCDKSVAHPRSKFCYDCMLARRRAYQKAWYTANAEKARQYQIEYNRLYKRKSKASQAPTFGPDGRIKETVPSNHNIQRASGRRLLALLSRRIGE